MICAMITREETTDVPRYFDLYVHDGGCAQYRNISLAFCLIWRRFMASQLQKSCHCHPRAMFTTLLTPSRRHPLLTSSTVCAIGHSPSMPIYRPTPRTAHRSQWEDQCGRLAVDSPRADAATSRANPPRGVFPDQLLE